MRPDALERSMMHSLDLIAEHWPHMLDAYSTPSRGGISGSLDEVTALDRIVSERDDATVILNGWCRVIMEDRPVSHGLPHGQDVSGMVTFLRRHALWLSEHEAAEDARDELAEVGRKCKLIAQPPGRDWIPIGPCPLEVDSDTGPRPCTGTVKAWPDQIEVAGMTLVELASRPSGTRHPSCDTCGTEGAVSWWERVMFPEVECHGLVTADEIPAMLHRAFGMVVKQATLRKWIERGVIESAGADEKGRTLYDRGAVAFALGRRARGGA